MEASLPVDARRSSPGLAAQGLEPGSLVIEARLTQRKP